MAGLIPQYFIDQLLNRIEITEIVGERIELKKAGSSYKACCPFHDEKTPSFVVTPSKQFYHCFGCGASGSAISFLMEYEHLSFPEAIEELAAKIGVDVPREQGAAPNKTVSSSYAVLEQCAQFYKRQLKSQTEAIAYLKERGISGKMAKRFGLGYAPGGWQTLENILIDCPQTQLLDAGMLVKNDNGTVYDRFRDRLMFPIHDYRGRIIGFGGRVLDRGEPKYLNSPETDIYHKGRELYGLYEARQYNRKLSSLVVVEGYMDVIGLAQHGIHNAVATLGTATTSEHLKRLFKVVNNVIFCFDGDRAGRQAAWRALKNTLPTLKDGYEARFLFLDKGEDPDSLIRSIGHKAFAAQLEHAEPLADVLFRELGNDQQLNSIGDRTRLAEAAKPLIEKTPGSIYRRLLFQRLSELVGIDIEAPIAANHSTPVQAPRRATGARRRYQAAHKTTLSPMRTAVSLLLQEPSVVQADDLERYDFDTQQKGGYILQKLIGLVLNQADISTAALIEHFRDCENWEYLRKLATTEVPGIDPDKLDNQHTRQLFLECLGQLSRAHVRQKQTKVRQTALETEFSDELKMYLRTTIPYTE